MTAVLFAVSIILDLTVVGSVVTEANAQPAIVIPYGATEYKYLVVLHGEGLGFEQPDFDDWAFNPGDAGFGTPGGFCELNNPDDVKTLWDLGTDILVRKEFDLPPGATDLVVSVAVDNDVHVFINGDDISDGIQPHEECPTRDSFSFAVPDRLLRVGTNLLAVRGRDRGVLSYLDIQVTAEIPTIRGQSPAKAGVVREH